MILKGIFSIRCINLHRIKKNIKKNNYIKSQPYDNISYVNMLIIIKTVMQNDIHNID